MTTAEVLLMIVPLDDDQKKKFGWPTRFFVPAIQCEDGLIVPSKDAEANSPGTFSWLKNDGTRVMSVVPPKEGK